MSITGLRNYIRDIRKCASKQTEQLRVNKELGKIRSKFKKSKKMSGYDRKKYVAKLLYTYMIGYDIDFGHIEAVELLHSKKYSEKQIGYLAVALLLNENDEFIKLIINSIHNDLLSGNEHSQCLALTAIANIGGKEMAEALTSDVQKLLVSQSSSNFVKKKAALCLLRLFRKYPDLLIPSEWANRAEGLLNNYDYGVLTSVLSLLLALVAQDPEGYKVLQSKAIQLLKRIVIEESVQKEYHYHNVPVPWLQVKLLRILQYWKVPKSKTSANLLTNCLNKILTGFRLTRSRNHNNARRAILFESINLIIHLKNSERLLKISTKTLLKFLSYKETNIRYLSLECLTHLTAVSDDLTLVKKHQDTIFKGLKETDIGIQKRALDLLYTMCDHSNSTVIVGELIKFLVVANYSIRDELVLKTAILAESFATDFSWYVDTILRLIRLGGDSVSDDIWHRVVRIVTNNPTLRHYASKVLFRTLQTECQEKAVSVGSYILGEFGGTIARERDSTPDKQLNVLIAKYKIVKPKTQIIILSSLTKLAKRHGSLREQIVEFIDKQRTHINTEIQQRSCEYYLMLTKYSDILEEAFENMPEFPQLENSLLKRIKEQEEDTMDPRAWSMEQKMREKGLGGSNKELTKTKEGEIEQTDEQPKEQQVKTTELISMNQDELIPKENVQTNNKVKEVSTIESQTIGENSINPMMNNQNIQNNQQQTSTSKGTSILDELSGINLNEGQNTQNNQQKQEQNYQSSNNNNQGQKKTNEEEIMGLFGSNNNNNNNNTNTRQNKIKNVLNSLILSTQEDPEQKLKNNFDSLCTNSGGVLYQDKYIQIGLKSQYHGSEGQLMLFYGNSQNSTFENFKTHITPVPYLKLRTDPVVDQIPGNTQQKQLLHFQCLQEFSSPPKINISFNCEELGQEKWNKTFQLPIVLSKFVQRVPLRAQEFMGRWKQIMGPPLGYQGTFVARTISAMEIGQILSGLGIQVLNGVDPNKNNIVGSGLFSAAKKKVGCLLRMETNLNKKSIKMTIKTTNTTVTSALKNLIQTQLEVRIL
ncbi:ap-2 complex subunit alpha [Anaeramoeba flamelloides]|uniref:AP-2 complex subunit alpha n=1 Tax=Anaeramoeba flamelloides TaxID=1746091 RepID=A0AAV7YN10_9EUKA|nr:ap-2 complex subunit alpha [Anaeramoeba flamelloides]